MATLDQIKEVVRGETDKSGSACKKFLLSALAPQNSLRNLVVTFLSLSKNVTKMMSLSSNRVQLRT